MPTCTLKVVPLDLAAMVTVVPLDTDSFLLVTESLPNMTPTDAAEGLREAPAMVALGAEALAAMEVQERAAIAKAARGGGEVRVRGGLR